jgi:hypothetical protein
MIPMYIAYSPTPQMLPTVTLNPTSTSTNPSSTNAAKVKRSEPNAYYTPKRKSQILNPDAWWWFGIGATALGSIAYFFF